MESKKILFISFLTVATVILSGCHAQNLNNGLNNIEGTVQKCKCKWNVDTITVPGIIFQYNYPTVAQYKRQIIYLYHDLVANIMTLHIPNRFKQKLLPDVPIEPNDVLKILTNEKVIDVYLNNPEHVTIEKAKETENVPKHYKLKIKTADGPNNINFDRYTTDEDFKSINPIISYPHQLISNSEDDKISKMPINNNEDFWPDSTIMNVPHIPLIDIKPDDFGREEPNYYNKGLWPESQVKIPYPHYIYPNKSKPNVFIKQEPVVPNYHNKGLWPESQVEVPQPHYHYSRNTKPFNFDKHEPVVPNYYNNIWPGTKVNVPHQHYLYPSNTKSVDSDKQEPVVPIDFNHDIWPDYLEPQPNSLHPNNIKSVDSGKQALDQLAQASYVDHLQPNKPMPNFHKHGPHNPFKMIRPDYTGIQRPCYSSKCKSFQYYKIQISPYDVQNQYLEPGYNVPHLYPHDHSNIKTVPFSKQKPVAPIHFNEDLHQPSVINPVESSEQESSWSLQVQDSHVFHPNEIKQFNYDDREQKYSIPASNSLHTMDIKPNTFGVREPGHYTEAPHSKPLHPNDIISVDFDKNESHHSEESPYSDSLQQSDNKPVDSNEKESDYSKEIPHSEPLQLSAIKPVDFNEKESDYSEEISNSDSFQQSDNKPVYSDEKETYYSEEIPHSQHLHPSDIKTVNHDENESDYSQETPYSDPLQPSDKKAVDYDEKDFYYSEEIPHSDSLQPSDIKPVYSYEKESGNPEETTYLDPFESSDNKPVYSGEKNFEYSDVLPHLDPAEISYTKTVYFDEKEFGHFEETPHLNPFYPTDIKPNDLDEKESGHRKETPHSDYPYPNGIKLIDFGKKEPGHSVHLHPLIIQRNEPKINLHKHRPGDSVNKYPKPCYHCKPTNDYKIQKPPYIIQNQYPEEIKWPIKLTTTVRPKEHYKKPMIDLTDYYKQKSWKDPVGYIGYKTFDQWFREEMRKFKNINQTVNVSSVGRLILKILNENGMFVTNGGVLKDSQGRILYLQNLKLRPILIGDSLTLDKLFEKDRNRKHYNHQADHALSTWSEYVVLNMLYPRRALGVIPLGTTFLPASDSLSSLYESQNNSKFWSKIAKKVHYDGRYKRHQLPEPENSEHILDQNISPDVSKDVAIEDGVGLSHDESVESFLNEMPHYSLLKKGYVDRQDNPLQINKVENSMTPTKEMYAQPKYDQRPKHPHVHNQNNVKIDNNELIRIIGGSSATGSGHALNNKGRSGNTNKPNNPHSDNHGPHNPKKHYHDYINWEELYRDDSLVRIIGGNAATGSGSPLSNKGRSGASY